MTIITNSDKFAYYFVKKILVYVYFVHSSIESFVLSSFGAMPIKKQEGDDNLFTLIFILFASVSSERLIQFPMKHVLFLNDADLIFVSELLLSSILMSLFENL